MPDIVQDNSPVWVEVHYLIVRGGSGVSRMYLHNVPEWLEKQHKAGLPTLIDSIHYV